MIKRLTLLREELASLGVDAFMVPHADEYQNEYLPASAERLAWITGFTGSAGTALILQDAAALFVDGRYILQAPQEVDARQFTVKGPMDEGPLNWLIAQLPKGGKLGFDPWLHPQNWVEATAKTLQTRNITLVPLPYNPLDKIWTDRPAPPCAPIVPHPMEFAGENSESKCARIGKILTEKNVNAFVISQPDSLAWLLNIRGGDIPHAPLPLAFAILHASGAVDLFADPRKLNPAVKTHLGSNVSLEAPERFAEVIRAFSKQSKLAADPATSAAWIFTTAQDNITRLPDPILLPKAIKNEAECNGTRHAHRRDGAAITRIVKWISISMPGSLDELQVMRELRDLRSHGKLFRDLSFETIAGSGPHGAIVHYRSSEKTNRKLEAGELFLLDSGAQYQDGTTDITRTIAIGTPTPEMKDRYTRVLKGHIALATAIFPKGTSGHQLDALARLPLWQAGLEFDHGTGHGVGSYLSVHEGPQRISNRPTAQHIPLEAGMIISNEPGYYKTGAYGIRLENLILVKPVSLPGAEREMLGFETLTLCPFDRHCIEPNLLLPHERVWLNNYHQRVRKELAELVDPDTSRWLDEMTAPL